MNGKQKLIEACLEQIKIDVWNCDLTVIEALICNLPARKLQAFLPRSFNNLLLTHGVKNDNAENKN